MIILGISAYYHDSAAALIVDGKVIAAVCEERFSRKKHDKSFPSASIKYCLKAANFNWFAIDHVVFYEKPFLKFERILTSHIHYAPKGFKAFSKAIPIWLKERLNMLSTIKNELNRLWGCHRDWDIRFMSHHYSHAAMAYYTSQYSDAAVLVVDAVGERATTSIFKAEGNRLSCLKQQGFPHSIGLLYSAFTYFLGFKVNSDEYKVMGLAPYGRLEDEQTRDFIEIIYQKLVDVENDGSIIIQRVYFKFMYGLEMINIPLWEKLFGLKSRKGNEPISQGHKNLAVAIQKVTEDLFLLLARHAKKITHSENLCLSGGCALNCAAMGKIRNSGLFSNVYVPFAPGDDGCAIGAALAFYGLLYKHTTIEPVSPYLGPSYTDEYIERMLQLKGYNYNYISGANLYEYVATKISEGNIVGWFQNRMEFGPRALGNRSILADARDAHMKDIVNSKIKFREEFRPFAPVVLQTKVHEYFNCPNSPYMMFTTQVNANAKMIPAVTHVDNSARVQTVSKRENERLYNLLIAYEQITGIPVLLNTSFNVMGEPIVCTPDDAICTFFSSGLDILVINDFIISK